jgi:hypothetical protein
MRSNAQADDEANNEKRDADGDLRSNLPCITYLKYSKFEEAYDS